MDEVNPSAFEMVDSNEAVQLHKQQLRCLRKLENLKAEMDYLSSDIKLQKELNTRHMKLTVVQLQQAILSRGKELAKQVNMMYDTRMSELFKCKENLDDSMRDVIKKIGKLDSLKKLTGEEYAIELKKYNEENSVESATYSVNLPAPCTMMSLASKPLMDAIAILQLSHSEAETMRDIEKESEIPTFDIKEGTELDMVCTDLWWSNKPSFTLLPAQDSIPAALDSLSERIRRLYIEDADWCCFGKDAPEVNGHVLTRLSTNKKWVRARVTSNNEAKHTSEVQLLDWGQTLQDVSWEDILPHRSEISSAPPIAVECVVEEEISPTAARDARWAFNDLMQKFSSSCIPLQVTFLKQVELGGTQVWKVDVVGTQPNGEVIDIGNNVRNSLSRRNTSSIQCHDIRQEFAATSVVVNEGNKVEQIEDTADGVNNSQQRMNDTDSRGANSQQVSEDQVTTSPSQNTSLSQAAPLMQTMPVSASSSLVKSMLNNPSSAYPSNTSTLPSNESDTMNTGGNNTESQIKTGQKAEGIQRSQVTRVLASRAAAINAANENPSEQIRLPSPRGDSNEEKSQERQRMMRFLANSPIAPTTRQGVKTEHLGSEDNEPNTPVTPDFTDTGDLCEHSIPEFVNNIIEIARNSLKTELIKNQTPDSTANNKSGEGHDQMSFVKNGSNKDQGEHIIAGNDRARSNICAESQEPIRENAMSRGLSEAAINKGDSPGHCSVKSLDVELVDTISRTDVDPKQSYYTEMKTYMPKTEKACVIENLLSYEKTATMPDFEAEYIVKKQMAKTHSSDEAGIQTESNDDVDMSNCERQPFEHNKRSYCEMSESDGTEADSNCFHPPCLDNKEVRATIFPKKPSAHAKSGNMPGTRTISVEESSDEYHDTYENLDTKAVVAVKADMHEDHSYSQPSDSENGNKKGHLHNDPELPGQIVKQKYSDENGPVPLKEANENGRKPNSNCAQRSDMSEITDASKMDMGDASVEFGGGEDKTSLAPAEAVIKVACGESDASRLLGEESKDTHGEVDVKPKDSTISLPDQRPYPRGVLPMSVITGLPMNTSRDEKQDYDLHDEEDCGWHENNNSLVQHSRDRASNQSTGTKRKKRKGNKRYGFQRNREAPFKRYVPDGGGSNHPKLCGQCGKSGHYSRDCGDGTEICDEPPVVRHEIRQHRESKQFTQHHLKCFFCHEFGHLIIDCPREQCRVSHPRNRMPKACYLCGEQGHIQRSCPRNHHLPRDVNMPPTMQRPKEM